MLKVLPTSWPSAVRANLGSLGRRITFLILSSPRAVAPAAIILAALLTLFETLYFASLRPGYSHISKTISELGESGAPHARLVAFGFFLPVGLLVWLALWLVHPQASDKYTSFTLLALSCLGTGYALSAFFPCDPGAPVFGSWRTMIHNTLGVIDYGGTGIGFLLFSRHLAKRDAPSPALAFLAAGILLLVGLALLCLEALFPVRGAIQRITELVQFAGVFVVCYMLPIKK